MQHSDRLARGDVVGIRWAVGVEARRDDPVASSAQRTPARSRAQNAERKLESNDQLPYAVGLVRQALERQLGNGGDA